MGKNLFIVHTSKESYQGNCQGKLSRLYGALNQGKLVQLYTRAIKTRQGKLGRLCGALNQGKLVQLYTRAIKTRQGKLGRQCTGFKSRKTCSTVHTSN